MYLISWAPTHGQSRRCAQGAPASYLPHGEGVEAGRYLSPLWRADSPSECPCYAGAVRPDISLTSCRPMTRRWISLVPSPISHTLASRIMRSTG